MFLLLYTHGFFLKSYLTELKKETQEELILQEFFGRLQVLVNTIESPAVLSSLHYYTLFSYLIRRYSAVLLPSFLQESVVTVLFSILLKQPPVCFQGIVHSLF